MMTLGWPWPCLWQICFLMLLHGWQLIQHIVMYFQACSNSAYPMHSCERSRPVVLWLLKTDENYPLIVTRYAPYWFHWHLSLDLTSEMTSWITVVFILQWSNFLCNCNSRSLAAALNVLLERSKSRVSKKKKKNTLIITDHNLSIIM